MPTTQLDTLSTAGEVTYTIPSWAHKIDVIALGGGGGGQGGGAGFNNGKSGAAGSYGAGLTLTRGVDFPWDKTTFRAYVGIGGNGGAGGASSNGQAGWNSALGVEYGAVGPGASGSGTNSVALSWTHTPYGYDNYVVVSLAVYGIGQGSFSTHTRTVTYGGTAMTFLGAVNANNLTNGWVESYGIAITPGASAQTVSVTVSKSGATYTNVKASSVSYGNVNAATVSAVTSFGNTSTSQSGLAYAFGGTLVGAAVGLGSTVSGISTLYTQAQRFINNTAPSFIMLDSLSAVTELSFAAATPWGHVAVLLPPRTTVVGTGGAANSITWVAPPTGRGGSPGNKTFNGQTYVGGTGSLNTNSGAPPATATAPGAGGGGSGGFLLGLAALGGDGSAGRVWIFAYNQFADASRTITATPTAIGLRQARVAPSLAVTATRTANSLTSIGLAASRAITATTSSVGLRNIPTNLTPLAVTATRTSAGLRNALVNGSVAVTVGLSSAFVGNNFAQATTSTTATITSAGLRNTLASNSTATTASISSATLRNIPSSTTQSETATITSAGLRNALVSGTSTITATRTAVPTQNASAMAGFSGANLVIPGHDSSRLSTEQFRSPGTSTKLVGNNNYVDSGFFPPYIPAVAGDRFYYETWVLGHPNNTVTNASGLFLGGGAYTEANAIIQYPSINQSQISPSMNGVWEKRSGIIVMPPGTAKAYFFVQLNPQAGTDIFYFDDSVVAKFDPIIASTTPLISLRGQLISPLTVTVGRTSVVLWAALFSASQAVNFSFSTVSLRNIPSQVSLPITATRSTVANFSAQLSSSTPVTDTTSSAARLLAVGLAPRTISCALTADSLRLARVDVAQAITATRDSIVRWSAYFAASRTITSTSSPVLKKATTIDATTLPGFPYYLPMRFGVAIRASFTGFITRFQYADVPRIITAARPANANAAFRSPSSLSVTSGLTTVLNSNQPTPTSTLAITGTQSSAALRNVFASGSLAVTATTSSASRFGGLANTTTPTVASFPTSATAILLLTKIHIITANRPTDSLRNARTGAALTVTAGRTPNVKWDSKTNSATAAITATPTAYAVCSTTIDATTLPGFPYYLPMRFGVTFSAGITATASNRFTAPTIPTAAIAAVSAASRAGWSATPSLLVTLNRSQNANLDADIAASATGSAASSPNTRKNIFISAINATITDTASGSLVAGFLVSSSLATTFATTAVNRLATVISTQTIATAVSSPSSLRTVRVASSLVVSGTLTAVANYRTTLASSRTITSLATGNLNLATTIDPTTFPGFPYVLPYRFGVTFKATIPASAGISQRINANLYSFFASSPNINARRIATAALAAISTTDYPGFPYDLPLRLGRLNTTANTATSIIANALVSQASTSSAKTQRVLSGILEASLGASATAHRNARVAATTLISATTLIDEIQNTAYFGSANLQVTASRTTVAANRTSASANLLANFFTSYPGFPYVLPLPLGSFYSQANVYNGISSSTPVSAPSSVSAKLNFSASASRQINVSLSAAAIDNENMSARLSVKAALVPCFPYDLPLLLSSAPNAQASMSRNQKFDTEQLQINSLRPAQLGVNIRAAVSLAVSFVTYHQVMPYTLPFLLGKLNTSFTLNRSAQSSSTINAGTQSVASLGQTLSAARGITASRESSVSRGHFVQTRLTVKNAIVPCFPYDLPLLLSSEPNARASALRNARVDASLITNAQRPTNIGILVKGSVSLAVTATTNYQTLPYTLPYLLGNLDTRASLSRTIQAALLGQATGTANASQNQKLSVARQINTLLTASGSRDALVTASLNVKSTTVPSFPYYLPFELNTVSAQQASATRITRASANTIAVGVRGMSPTFMPGFPFILPFRIGLTAPSPVMSLGTRASSSTAISTALSAEASRKLFALSSVTISATTQSTLSGKITFASHLAVGPTQTPELNVFPYELPYQFVTYRSEPPRATLIVSSRISSTTLAVTARTYGFPYQLPIKLGPVNSAKLTKFISAQTTINTTASALLLEAGSTHVVLPVLASRPASARLRANIAVNSRPGFPLTLPLLLQGASFEIAVNKPATLGFVRLASSQVNVTASRSALIYASYVGRAELSIAARPTANAKFSVAISSNLGVAGIITALGKYRINLAAPLTASPISFVRMNFRTRISSPLAVQNGLSANATFDTVLAAPLTASAIADTILSEVSRNSASLSATATRSVSGLRDTKASASTSVSATTSAAMFLAAKAVGVLPVAVSLSAETKGLGRVLVSLETSSDPIATLLQRSAISAPRNISFGANTVINQYQEISTTVSSLADLLSVVTKDQKIGAPTSATLAGIFSSILRSVTATTQPVIVASRTTVARGDFFCGTQAGITVQPSIQVRWDAYANINSLDVAAGLGISASRGQFLVSIGTAVSATVTASAEPYHSAGTFLPFFYVGSSYT